MKKYLLRRIGVASNASATRPSLADCIELVLGQAKVLAGDVLAAVKTSAGSPAAEPAPDDDEPELKRTVTRLVAQAESFSDTFSAELRRLVYQSGSQDFAKSPLGRVEDIHVFDIQELEAHIELALARQEVVRAVDDVLPLFDALVTALLGWSTVQPGLNPLKPEAFVRALNETMDAWVPDEGVRTTLLRPAAMALGTGMRQLYRETCDWLRSQGVEPVEPPTGKPLDSAAARSALAGTEVERTMLTLDKLRRLLAGESLQGAGGAGMRDFTHTVPASLVALQDLKLVEPMMKRLSERSVQAVAQGGAAVRGAPAPQLVRTQAQNQQIGHQLGEEVVRFMLDQLVQDERLLMPVRVHLRALEPVLVRLAKLDPRFFIDRTHAARKLLDRVVQSGLAYTKDDEDGVAGFVACVANAVNLLCRGAGDAGAFATVLEQLEEDWTAFDDMRRRQKEAALNARQHAEQRMLLAQRFSGAMMERFKNGSLPELVASFLRGPWSQVLAEARLGSDDAEADPGGYLALVDDLVWSVQPPLALRDYTRLVRLVPRLLGRLGEGLMLIRYPQEPVSIFLDDLSALHEKAFDDHRRALAAARAAAASQPEAEAGDTRILEQEDSDGPTLPGIRPPAPVEDVQASGPVSVRDVVVGSQVDLLLEDVWVRADLTWVSHNRNLFMFVSKGGVAHAMSQRTMDRLEVQERIRVVAVTLAVDLELEFAEQGAAPV